MRFIKDLGAFCIELDVYLPNSLIVNAESDGEALDNIYWLLRTIVTNYVVYDLLEKLINDKKKLIESLRNDNDSRVSRHEKELMWLLDLKRFLESFPFKEDYLE